MPHEKVDQLIRRFQRLSHDRHFRSTQQQIAIEGIRNVISAVECCQPSVALIHCRRLLRSSVTERLIAEQRNFAVRVVNVSPEQFRSFSTARHASGVAAITSVATQRLAAVHIRNDDCWVALSEVRSAGNFGSLVRTAAALGATGFLLIGQSADPFSPDTIRASMGSFFRQQFVRTSWTEFAEWRQQHNVTVVGVGMPRHLQLPVSQTPLHLTGGLRKSIGRRLAFSIHLYFSDGNQLNHLNSRHGGRFSG